MRKQRREQEVATESEGENSVSENQIDHMAQPTIDRDEVPRQQLRALCEIALPNAVWSQTSIARATINVNNFEIKLALI